MKEKLDLNSVSHADFLDMIEEGKPIYFECDDCGCPSLPPRKACADCGSMNLKEKELSSVGEVASFTQIHVPTPMFGGEAPFTVAIVEFEEGVRLTGQLRGAKGDKEVDVELGDEVELGVEEHDEVERLVIFTKTQT